MTIHNERSRPTDRRPPPAAPRYARPPRRRRAVLAAVLAAGVAAATATTSAPAGATRQAAATGVPIGVHVVQKASAFDHQFLFKSARATCGDGEVVVGGGAQVFPDNSFTRQVALRSLVPIKNADGQGHDSYSVTAVAVDGVQVDWKVTAFAVCARAGSVPTHHIVPKVTGLAEGKTTDATAAVCPSGERVLGTGAEVVGVAGSGDLVLQVARPDGPGGIARVQGHVGVEAFTGPWRVGAYAICAATPLGYKVAFGRSDEAASESRKDAFALCPGQQPLGFGGAVTNVAPANASLQSIEPFANSSGKGSKTLATENTPTTDPWDFIVTTAVCVNNG
ncbi:MAG TPA: hypothetical protein VFI47_10230 [Acidimicrobiales bacterium]|nr:hypothetical protein [Acidimicrobiales bacterium]